MAIFKKAGAIDGAKKCFKEFNIPMERATRLIKNIYGNIILFNLTVKRNFSGIFSKPGAIILINRGEKYIPETVTTNKIIDRRVKETEAMLSASSLPFSIWYLVKIGMNDAVKEPSPNNLLKRLGILKATKNASATKLVPRKFAITTSLINPRTLLIRVDNPIIRADLKINLL